MTDSTPSNEHEDGGTLCPSLEAMLASGMALLHVPLGVKKPSGCGWNRPERAIVTPSRAFELAGTNVGLAHAYCTPRPTAAIDIDDYHPAKAWLSARGVDLDALLFSVNAVAIWSGKPRSIKLLYRLPHGQMALPTQTVKGPTGKMLLELRCATANGLTVHDLVPPSTHPSGTIYRWMGEGDPLNPPDVPGELLKIWQSLLVPPLDGAELSRRLRQQSRATLEETPREVATMRDRLKYISADCDYAQWRNIVWAILSTGWQSAEDLARGWSMTAPHRFDERAFMNVVTSYRADRPDARTAATITFFARMGGWNG